MKIVRLTIYYLLQMTWGIIQNVLGFLIWLYVLLTGPKEERRFFYGALVTRWNLASSMSMGMFLFLGTDSERVIVHEYGHSIQSLILGRSAKRRYRFTSFYPEKWANHLGRLFTGKEPIRF